MKRLPPEYRKYVNTYGLAYGGQDHHIANMKPLARCTRCVEQYGDAPKHDHLTLNTVHGKNYLLCKNHRRYINGQR